MGRPQHHQHTAISVLSEVIVRIILIIIFFVTEDAVPFFRKIQPEEFWLYSFPRTLSYYPGYLLWITLFAAPVGVIGTFFTFRGDKIDSLQALLGVNFSIFLSGCITNFIKLGVGRPRPDFLARCFPDGDIHPDMNCKGSYADVIQGYKSFPSGHSALSFSCMVFLSLYIAGKLHCFGNTGRGSAWRICCVVTPVMWAAMIAVSRTADYHHHWQDVSVGSILGSVIAFMCYRQYYPAVNRHNSHIPYISQPHVIETDSHLLEHPEALSPSRRVLSLDDILKKV